MAPDLHESILSGGHTWKLKTRSDVGAFSVAFRPNLAPRPLQTGQARNCCQKIIENQPQESMIVPGCSDFGSAIPGRPKNHESGYLKSGRIYWGAGFRSGRPREPGKAFKNVGGFASRRFEGLPGPPGPARHQKRTLKRPRPDCRQVPSFNTWFWGRPEIADFGCPGGPQTPSNKWAASPHIFWTGLWGGT